MYTYNIFCYGHDFSKNHEVSVLLDDVMCRETVYYDPQSDAITDKAVKSPKTLYEVDFPYHGGQIAGDTPSICFGVCITSSESNDEYVREVRNAKGSDYSAEYAKFVDAFKRHLNKVFVGHNAEEIKPIIDFLDSNQPCFYSVEASS